MRLTTLGIEGLKAAPKQKTHFDEALPGFGVRVSPGGAKTFVLMVGRRRQLVSIGRYPTTSLKEARTAALRLIAEHDPKKCPPTRLRLSEAVERFMQEKQAQTRPESQRQYDRYLNLHLRHVQNKYLDDVTTDDITRITDRMLKEKKGPSANHMLVAAKTFFKWCMKRRLISHSPADGLDRPAKEFARERVLTDDELRRIWERSPTVVRVLILLGQRRMETANIRGHWLKGMALTIPGQNTKNRITHTLPIPAIALPLVAEVAAHDPYYAWSRIKTDIDTQSGVTGWHFHDCRRSYAVNLQRLKVRTEVIECLLNHRSGYKSGVTGIYQRYDFWDEMREAVDTYEEWFRATILQETQVEEY